MKPLLTLAIVCTLFFSLVTPTSAQVEDTFEAATITDSTLDPSEGFVPCSGASCSSCHVLVLANTIIKWLIGITFLLFGVLAMIAGIRLVTSQGKTDALTSAKASFINAFIGLAIILCAWLIVDVVMKNLVGNQGNISGFGPWSQVKCATQAVSETKEDYYEGDPENFYVPAYITDPSSSGGGSCSVITNASNPCHPDNLAKYFGARAEEASKICNKESGGRVVNSRSDICCGTNGCQSSDPSFSGGVFQINILANARLIPGCTPGAFYKKNANTSRAEGTCVRRNGRGICTGWSCEITDTAMYNRCMLATNDIIFNLQTAQKLYNQSGGFRPWDWSRKLCGVR